MPRHLCLSILRLFCFTARSLCRFFSTDTSSAFASRAWEIIFNIDYSSSEITCASLVLSWSMVSAMVATSSTSFPCGASSQFSFSGRCDRFSSLLLHQTTAVAHHVLPGLTNFEWGPLGPDCRLDLVDVVALVADLLLYEVEFGGELLLRLLAFVHPGLASITYCLSY